MHALGVKPRPARTQVGRLTGGLRVAQAPCHMADQRGVRASLALPAAPPAGSAAKASATSASSSAESSAAAPRTVREWRLASASRSACASAPARARSTLPAPGQVIFMLTACIAPRRAVTDGACVPPGKA